MMRGKNMLRVHKIVRIMDNPKKRRNLLRRMRKKRTEGMQGYLTFAEVVRLVRERKHKRNK